MNTDVELETWREMWRADAERVRVPDRNTQAPWSARGRTVVASLALAALLAAAAFTARAAASTGAMAASVAGTAWALLLMVAVLSVWQFWSERTHAGEASAAFLAHSIERRLGAMLAVACGAFLLIALWLPWAVALAWQPVAAAPASLVVLILPPCALAVVLWRVVRWRSELTYFREIEAVAQDEMAAQDHPFASEHELGRMRPSRWHRRTRKSEVQR